VTNLLELRRLPHLLGLLVLPSLTGCGGKEIVYVQQDVDSIDNDGNSDDTGDAGGDDGGSGSEVTDADSDGYDSRSDCDDNNPAINPGTVETCNGEDDDCDGTIDDVASPPTWYPDGDGDGWGVAEGDILRQCEAPESYAAKVGDCDDTRADVFPDAATDVCEPDIDADCDGVVDHQDADDDGFLSCEDCDDSAPEVFPGADEVCNDLDDDCDDTIDEPDALDAAQWYADADSDGFGDPAVSTLDCDAPSGFVADNTDCDDSNDTAFPGGTEVCDGADNNCDGTEDGPTSTDAVTWYADTDTDGFGDPAVSIVDCTAPTGFVADNTDCDDTDASSFPGGFEVCGGGDEDCDGFTDDADSSVTGTIDWYADADRDTYGDASTTTTACEGPTAWVADATDCDDTDSDINPGASEMCDDVDNNCDSTIDEDTAVDARSWYLDDDNDAYGVATTTQACDWPVGYAAIQGDCDDTDAAVNPGATDIWYDGTDSDCGGNSDYDADDDGYDSKAELSSGTDCEDSDDSISPGVTETWYDGVDSDCDGAGDYDADGDGYDSDDWGGGDCEDSVATAFPGGSETWYDGVDGDCDGRSDYDADLDGFDSDSYSGDDCDDTDAAIQPYAWEDDTDGVDNDCDSYIDTLDADTLRDLGLGDDDDGSVEVTISTGWSFPFCGTTYTEFNLNGNGLLSFDTATTDYSESKTGLTSTYAPAIALYWDDFDLGDNSDSTVWGQTHSDAVTIHFREAEEFFASTSNSFSLTLFDDGRLMWDFGSMAATDGLVGWGCGTGTGEEVDWSAEREVGTEGLPTVGIGTEDAMWQLFDWSDYNDLSDSTLWSCGTAGDDDDGDGYTDVCGDPDDTDSSVTP